MPVNQTILSIIFNFQIYWCFLGFNIFTDQVQQFYFIMKFMVTKKDKVSNYLVKFVFSKKATKIDEIFTIDLTLTT